jgi:magnesium-transporting ATPase (P-type)
VMCSVAVTGSSLGDVVALGVKDAVGVAVGGGATTDACRAASSLVLTDDDPTSLGEAVLECRRLLENARKV